MLKAIHANRKEEKLSCLHSSLPESQHKVMIMISRGSTLISRSVREGVEASRCGVVRKKRERHVKTTSIATGDGTMGVKTHYGKGQSL
jgi:hypothetical protein